MQRTDSTGKAKSTHRRVGSSTTLNRRYVKRPKQSMDMVTSVPVRRSPKIKKFNDYQAPEYASALKPEVEGISMAPDGMDAEMPEEMGMAMPEEMSMVASERMNAMQPEELYGLSRSEEMMDSGMSSEMFDPTGMQDVVDSASSEELFAAEASEGMSSSSAEQYYNSVANEEMMAENTEYVEPHPLQKVANTRMQTRKRAVTQKTKKPTAKELKERAIKQALASASMMEETEPKSKHSKNKKLSLLSIGLGRVVLAFSCAALAVFAIVYFVNMNMPDVSLKVAAMQTGINATYPSYVPRDYSISSITSENKKITLVFKNNQTDEKYSIIEETSSWDSNALLSNYVKPAYGENFNTVREQGLTIYISGSNAVWVNGGVMYVVTSDNEVLSNKQIRSIATSL